MMSSGLAAHTTFYFAYGFNLYSERIRIANKSATFKSVGLLQGYRLEFDSYMSKRWRGAAANIFPDAKSHVYGVLWELNVDDLENLDMQEGVKDGIYERIKVNVQCKGKNPNDDEMVDCWAYQITNTCREQSIAEFGDKLKPSTVYKNVILKGAKENNLPPEYIRFLESIVDNGYDGEVSVNIDLKEQ